MKTFLIVFCGLSLLMAWFYFWFDRYDEHDWPILPCFMMGAILPIAIVAAIVSHY